mmetsp:Transcript_36321/g.116365  ORF Transcript_36321/g.116365 Transcript_36321/m.116365 type:complete len:332 (-) Transcript_36321:1318-2313(-)
MSSFELRREDEAPIAITGSLTVGRDHQKCDVILDHQCVSRRHARLVPEDDKLYLVPETTKEVICVNGEETTRKRLLEPGDEVAFFKGNADFTYKVSKRRREMDRDVECPVCSGILACTHMLPCGHAFCGACLMEALAQRPQCPMCAAAVAPGNVVPSAKIVDTLIEKKLKDLPQDEVDDYDARTKKWLASRRQGQPFEVPGAAARRKQTNSNPPRFADRRPPGGQQTSSSETTTTRGGGAPPGRVFAARPRDIRAHFGSNTNQRAPTSYANLRETIRPPAPPRPPPRGPRGNTTTTDNNSNQPPPRNDADVIDLVNDTSSSSGSSDIIELS